MEKRLDCRLSRSTQQWDIHVKWIGLEKLEASWEPALVLLEDVPVIVSRWIHANATQMKVARMQSALEPVVGHAL